MEERQIAARETREVENTSVWAHRTELLRITLTGRMAVSSLSPGVLLSSPLPPSSPARVTHQVLMIWSLSSPHVLSPSQPHVFSSPPLSSPPLPSPFSTPPHSPALPILLPLSFPISSPSPFRSKGTQRSMSCGRCKGCPTGKRFSRLVEAMM